MPCKDNSGGRLVGGLVGCAIFQASRTCYGFKPILKWPEFDVVCKLTLEKVVPRLLLPLQSEGRTLKPCLIHGDCWDGNTTDMKTGEAFVFDVCPFYEHNKYNTGNWRAPRHRLSRRPYIQNYKRFFPVSEPGKHPKASVECPLPSPN
jgi:protein-ribulosamine 3-kinase